MTAPKIIDAKLTNLAYGYPQGQQRKHSPAVLMVIHITGNRRTAASNGTRGEVAYMNRPIVQGGHYNSAHNYIDRNGVVYACVPLEFPAWNNGDLLKPNKANAGVRALLIGASHGINPNELCYREIECTGYPGSFPVTDAQLESAAYLIARDSLKTGLAITRGTVLTHADINSVNRANCAFPPGQREAKLTQLIQRAKALKLQMKPSDPPPPVDPPPVVDPCQDVKDQLEAADGLNSDLQDRLDAVTALLEKATDLGAQIVALDPTPDGG